MSDILEIDEWNRLWMRLGASQPPKDIHVELLKRYSERHRVYHTRSHLADCLLLLQGNEGLCERPYEVALALWFHDAIYRTHRRDNEERSAEWLVKVTSATGIPPDAISRMRALVMATRHAAVPLDRDAQVLVDIDLAILGSSPERFEQFEQQIRMEYKWVPLPIYRRERSKILADFLARPQIYSIEWFALRFENQARANLRRSIERLRKG